MEVNSISTIVATFGDDRWKEAAEVAADSVRNQVVAPHELIVLHGDSLHEARNSAAESATGRWLLFLDADDWLHPHFIRHMKHKVSRRYNKNLMVRPAIKLHGNRKSSPHVLPRSNLMEANFMIIGTLVSRELFFEAGGFRDLPVFEDWDLWIRCALAGGVFGSAPRAIYNINIDPGGRNSCDIELRRATHARIRSDYKGVHYL